MMEVLLIFNFYPDPIS
jgi:hypothetical protein